MIVPANVFLARVAVRTPHRDAVAVRRHSQGEYPKDRKFTWQVPTVHLALHVTPACLEIKHGTRLGLDESLQMN